MNRKTILALALASAFGLSTFAAYAEDEQKKDSPYPQLIADEDKKETSPYPQMIVEDEKQDAEKPQLIADEEKKDEEKPQLVAEADDVFPTGSTPDLIA